MKKRIAAVFLCAVMGLTGCGAFQNGKEEAEAESSIRPTEAEGDVVIGDAPQGAKEEETDTEAVSEEMTATEETEEEVGEVDWNGTFRNENDSVMITESDGTINFTFKNAGISGNASIDDTGRQAICRTGDDGYQILLHMRSKSVSVTVMNTQNAAGESEAEEESALTGKYERQ